METRDPCVRRAPGARAQVLLVVGATLVGSLMLSSLAPAAHRGPESKVPPANELPREWRGHRPDLDVDGMFRRDMPRQGSFQDAYRRPR